MANRCHIWDSINLANTDLPGRSPETPTHPAYGPTQAAFPYKWLIWLLKHKFLNLFNKQQLLSVNPRPGTSSSQLRFTAWLRLGISKPRTSSSHLRLLCSSGKVAPGKTQVGADLVLYHPGNPRGSKPSGQLHTTSEHHCPVPAQLIYQGGQRLGVSSHCQSLQLTGLGKSLPLIC